jgi:GR25 family glycosyltransferase involved in LPS biosynthesis
MSNYLENFITLLSDGYELSTKNNELFPFLIKYTNTIGSIISNYLKLFPNNEEDINNLLGKIYREYSSLYLKNKLSFNDAYFYATKSLEYLGENESESSRNIIRNVIQSGEFEKMKIEYPIDVVNKLNKWISNDVPHPINSIKNIIFTMTTCKRFDLFEKTLNSFLSNCIDIDQIDKFLVVDDNSSESDRKRMKELYPFIEFIFKDENDKGHVKSMNIIRDRVLEYKYQFHLEDDWLFIWKDKYITKCKKVIDSDNNYGQCLLNKNYSEAFETIKGGLVKYLDNSSNNNDYFYEHEHYTGSDLDKHARERSPSVFYWPHFSFRVGMTKTSIYNKIGEFHSVSHFEMEYAHRYVSYGYKTTYLKSIYCIHIGKRTWENTVNAYKLNNISQFGEKVKENVGGERKQMEKKNDEKKIKHEIISIDELLNGKREEKKEVKELVPFSNNNIQPYSSMPQNNQQQPTLDQTLMFELINLIAQVNNISKMTNNGQVNINTNLLPVLSAFVKKESNSSFNSSTSFNSSKYEAKEKREEQSKQIIEKREEKQQSLNTSSSHHPSTLSSLSSLRSSYKIKTYILNLERRPDRLEKFKQTNPSLNTLFESNVFKAVDGKNLVPNNHLLKLFETNDFNWKRGVIGCACSHIMMWLELLNSEYDSLLVLEDDATLCEQFPEKFIKLLGEMKNEKDVDLVYLGFFCYPNDKIKQQFYKRNSEPRLEKRTKKDLLQENMGGTFGYLITKSGALKMIEFIQSNGVFNGIDWVMNKSPLNTYVSNPHLVYSIPSHETGADTDIQHDSSTMKVD